MRNNIGVIGHPINHSMSPVFQQAALDYLDNKNVFEKWDVHPEKLEEIYAIVLEQLTEERTNLNP